jgi:signal recognition particle receptor subunit alpha
VFVLSKFAKTPRKKYMRYVSFTEPSWGAEYPKWTNLGVIAISYAIIAPLVLGFATVGIGLKYLTYRYNMLYVHDTHVDTKGGFYARALEQLMVGVYLGELCLLGLFGIGIGDNVTSAGPTVLQVILLVATIIFHLFMKRKIKQLDLLNDEDHPRQQNDVEGGRIVERNGMHPGYSNAGDGRNGNRRSDQALVSRYHDRESRHHAGAEVVGMTPPSDAPPQRSLFKRIFSPHTLTASQISASLIPRFRHPVPPYTEQDILEAYLHPALAQREEVIWLARDPAGVSKNEVAELRASLGSYGVEATDEGAIMNEKGKVEWDVETVRQAPLWGHKVVY